MKHFLDSLPVFSDFSLAAGAAPPKDLAHELGCNHLQTTSTVEVQQICSPAHEVFQSEGHLILYPINDLGFDYPAAWPQWLQEFSITQTQRQNLHVIATITIDQVLYTRQR